MNFKRFGKQSSCMMANNVKILKELLLVSVLIFGIFIGSTECKAQRFSVTSANGVSNYRGDLATEYVPPFKLAVSIGASYDLTPRYRLRLNLSQMSVEGDDTKSPKAGVASRNLNFKSAITEGALVGELDLLDPKYHSIIPYVFGGIGVFHFNPYPLKKKRGGDGSLRDIGTEGQFLPGGKYADRQYKLTQMNLQFGGGVRYEFSETVSLGVEANYRRLFTDYLDDVSTDSYIPKSEFNLSDPKQVAASDYNYRGTSKFSPTAKRGNPQLKDAYYTFLLRLNIRLNNFLVGSDVYSPSNPNGKKQLKCPKKVF